MSDNKKNSTVIEAAGLESPMIADEGASLMIKPREIIPIMAQSADPLGSYTGTPAGAENTAEGKTPVQDADDL
ncbi:MAG: hypothetical protein FWG45_07950 [Oscillospiraceae bacterium]|nr:hypothetical protein [Oscillospiraceae bacterium]